MGSNTPSSLSPENEQFIQSAIEAGTFQSRTEAIDAGVELLRRQEQILNHIDRGRRQLDNGEYTQYDDQTLRERFDQLQQRDRNRIGAGQEGK